MPGKAIQLPTSKAGAKFSLPPHLCQPPPQPYAGPLADQVRSALEAAVAMPNRPDNNQYWPREMGPRSS